MLSTTVQDARTLHRHTRAHIHTLVQFSLWTELPLLRISFLKFSEEKDM